MTLIIGIIIGVEIHLHLGNGLPLSINRAIIFVEELDINLVMMHTLLRPRLLLGRTDGCTGCYIIGPRKGEERTNHTMLIAGFHPYSVDTITIKTMGTIFPRCVLISKIGLIVQGQFHVVIGKRDMITLPGIDKRATITISIRSVKKGVIGAHMIKKCISTDALRTCLSWSGGDYQEAE